MVPEKSEHMQEKIGISSDLHLYNQLLKRIQEDSSCLPDFKQEQKRVLGNFLRLQNEYHKLLSVLASKSSINALEIETLIRELRVKLQRSQIKLEDRSMSTTFLNVIDREDQLIERGYIRMDDVNPVSVPFVYHWAPNEAIPAIKQQGILPPFALGSDSGLYGFASFQRTNNYWHGTLLHQRARSQRDIRVLKMKHEELLEEAEKQFTLLKIEVVPETTFYTWPMEMVRFVHQAPLAPSRLDSVWGGDLISSKLVPLENVMGFYIEHDIKLKQTQKRSERMSKAYAALRKQFSESMSLKKLKKQYPRTYSVGSDDDSFLWKKSEHIGADVPPKSWSTKVTENTEIRFDYIPPHLISEA